MALLDSTRLINLATIVSITIIPLLLILHSTNALFVDNDIEDGEEYTVDYQPLGKLTTQLSTRYKPQAIRKGETCDAMNNNICNNLPVNNGTGLLQCCKTHCRNVLGDRNNCGSCGHKCGFGELCCGGTCTSVAYNVNNCGKCGNKCLPGLKCEYGTCGYA